MAEKDDSKKTKKPDLNQAKESTITDGSCLKGENDDGQNVKDNFEECAGFGKAIIDNIKCQLEESQVKNEDLPGMKNPYKKAYRYLEGNQVLPMLEELITQTVYRQPGNPCAFMRTVVDNFYDEIAKK